MLAQRYYSPYPTMSDLRASRLGDVAEQRALAEKNRLEAAKLGISLPARPADLDETGQQAAYVLESIDLSSARLARAHERLTRLLHQGGAVCRDLLAYNRLAIEVYEIQMEVIKALQRARVGGVPPAPPWPPLFIGFGSNKAPPAADIWEIDCKARIVGWAQPDGSRGVKLYFQSPECIGRSELGVAVTTMVIGAALIGAIAGAGLYFRKEALVEIAKAVEKTRQIDRLADLVDKRTEALDLLTGKCVASGGDYTDCLEEADSALERLEDIEAALDRLRDKPGKGLLWWIGLAAVATGGVVVYKVVKRRRRNRGALVRT